MKAVILCGGYATRLYPLTLNQPKPLLPIGGKPLLNYILENLEKVPVLDEVVVITNNKFHTHFENWAKTVKTPLKITIVNDKTMSNDERLGAVGCTFYAINSVDSNNDFMVIAGDNLFEMDLNQMYLKFKEKDSSLIAVYDLGDPEKLANKFGVVLTNDEDKVIDFEEKPPQPKSSLTATLIYMLKKEDINFVKKEKPHLQSLEIMEQHRDSLKDLDNAGELIKFLSEKSSIYTFPVDQWIDIGSKEDYERANEKIK